MTLRRRRGVDGKLARIPLTYEALRDDNLDFIGGVEMGAGTMITIGIGAANRDPAVFPDPERMDVSRRPNRHLAFGSGIHQCAGMNLARLEGAIAISMFLKRFPRYALAGLPVRGGRARFRGFLKVPVDLA